MSLLHGILSGRRDWRSFIARHVAAVDAELRACELHGDCETTVEVWARHLAAAGFKGCRVQGVWRHGGVTVSHWWLYVEAEFFDPTANQFYELEGVAAEDGEYLEQQRVCW